MQLGLLEAAHRTAVAIAADAIHADGRCNWVGATVRAGQHGEAYVDYAALPPYVYEGTSGVAIFLAEVAAETDDKRLAQTAVEAIRQALEAIDSEPLLLSPYLGALGTVLAGAYIGKVLGNDEVHESSQRRRTDVLTAPVPDGFDLLSGCAGATLGLLDLYKCCGDVRALELALACANALVRDARDSPSGTSWAHPTIKAAADLTGLSHGTSGPILALLEVNRYAGSDQYFRTAMRALDYESGLFSPEVSNWPDFREDPAGGRTDRTTLSYAPFWCHGAPGILAARLRILDLLHDEHVHQTQAAVSATMRAIEAMLQGSANYSICHGLAGNTEILLLAAATQTLADPADALRIAEEVCQIGVERYSLKNDWPSGVQQAPNPSLFVGSAGAGRLLLRLARPGLPTLLTPGSGWPRPDDNEATA